MPIISVNLDGLQQLFVLAFLLSHLHSVLLWSRRETHCPIFRTQWNRKYEVSCSKIGKILKTTVVPYIQYWSLLSMKSYALQIKKPPFPARVKERIHYHCGFWQKHSSFRTKYNLMCRSHWPTMQAFTSVCPQHDDPVMWNIIL